jgi:hypothetical protein
MLGVSLANGVGFQRSPSGRTIVVETPPPTSSTPDLFSFTFIVELKGQIAQVEVGTSALLSEVYEKALAIFGDKLKKEAIEKFFFLKDSAIYLPHTRRVDSFLLFPDIGEAIELSLKKKDKKSFPMVVLLEGKTETVEITANTTVQGVIQLLPRRTADDEFMTLFNKKGKLDLSAKVSSLLKKDEALEARVDLEMKSASGAANKKQKRKSMVTLKKSSITPSSSSTSLAIGSAVSRSDKDKEKKNLEKFLGSRPSEADLKKKNILVDLKTDMKASAPAAVDPNSALPLQLKLFVQLGTFLKTHLELIGLFRVSGDVEDVKSFYHSMWTKIAWEQAKQDPHIASSALKLYLRKQADPLIPFSLYNEFLASQKIEDEEQQITAIKAAIQKLPEPNSGILHYLIHLLTLVAEKEPSNKMNPINIGIVFGPTIMWDPKPNVMDYSSTGYQSALVTNMIDHYPQFWSSPPPDAPINDDTTSETNSVASLGTATSSPGNSIDRDPAPILSPVGSGLDHSSSDPTITRPSPMRPAPMHTSVSVGPPKKMPPKMPMGPPPNNAGGTPNKTPPVSIGAPGAGSGGLQQSTSGDAIQSRSSFRKSLPPTSSLPQIPGGTPPSTLASTPEEGSVLESGPSSRPMPPSSSPIARRSLAFSKLDTLIHTIDLEVRENIMVGSCSAATTAVANIEDLKNQLSELPQPVVVKHLLTLLAAIGGKQN